MIFSINSRDTMTQLESRHTDLLYLDVHQYKINMWLQHRSQDKQWASASMLLLRKQIPITFIIYLLFITVVQFVAFSIKCHKDNVHRLTHYVEFKSFVAENRPDKIWSQSLLSYRSLIYIFNILRSKRTLLSSFYPVLFCVIELMNLWKIPVLVQYRSGEKKQH